MTTLYDLGEGFGALEQLIEEATERGAPPAETEAILAAWFAELAGDLTAKAARCVRVIRSQEALADAAKAESARLTAYARGRQAAAERVSTLLRDVIERAGSPRLETDVGAVWVQRAGGKQALQVDDVDPTTIDPALTVVETRVDKDAVRAKLDAGEALPFARLLPRTTSLRIR